MKISHGVFFYPGDLSPAMWLVLDKNQCNLILDWKHGQSTGKSSKDKVGSEMLQNGFSLKEK